MNSELMKKLLAGEGLELDAEAENKLMSFASELRSANEKMNLTALTSPDEITLKHFFDSMLVFKTGVDFRDKKVLDLGTGAGFPGLVMKIVCPELDIVLVDSLEKRLHFLVLASEKLALSDVKLKKARAEDLGRDVSEREAYDLVVARAVARLPVLLELAMPLLKIGGQLIALKGPEADAELEESKKAFEILSAEPLSESSFNLPEYDYRRKILVIKKTDKTPEKYPRRAGIVQKRPLK